MNTTQKEKELKFYVCTVCGNVIYKLVDSGLTPQCCGRDMVELIPGTVDASIEKHVPVWMMDGCKVIIRVGEDAHPMTKDHYIKWVLLKTTKGIYIKDLEPGEDPVVCFKICKGETVKCVYEYCNLHKLWKNNREEIQNEC